MSGREQNYARGIHYILHCKGSCWTRREIYRNLWRRSVLLLLTQVLRSMTQTLASVCPSPGLLSDSALLLCSAKTHTAATSYYRLSLSPIIASEREIYPNREI